MKRWLTIALCATIGCASPRAPKYVSLPQTPSEEVRAQLGQIAVVTTNEPALTEFTQPMGKGRAAGHGGWVGFWAAPAAGGAVGEGYGLILGLFLSPVTGAGGALYGAVAGMSQKEYARIHDTLQKTVQDADFAGELQTAVGDSIRQLTSQPLVQHTPGAPPASSTLELVPIQIKLAGPKEIEPPLTFECAVRVRLLKTADGTEFFAGEYRYIGARYNLRQWAAQDGALLRQQLAGAGAQLAQQIAERMFLVYPLPDSPAQQRVLSWPPPRSR